MCFQEVSGHNGLRAEAVSFLRKALDTRRQIRPLVTIVALRSRNRKNEALGRYGHDASPRPRLFPADILAYWWRARRSTSGQTSSDGTTARNGVDYSSSALPYQVAGQFHVRCLMECCA